MNKKEITIHICLSCLANFRVEQGETKCPSCGNEYVYNTKYPWVKGGMIGKEVTL